MDNLRRLKANTVYLTRDTVRSYRRSGGQPCPPGLGGGQRLGFGGDRSQINRIGLKALAAEIGGRAEMIIVKGV